MTDSESERTTIKVGEGSNENGVAKRWFRLVFRSIKAHPIPHIIGISAGNLFSLVVVSFTIVLGRVTDKVIIPGLDGDGVEGRTILGGFVAIVIVGLIRGFSVMLRRFFNFTAVEKTKQTWRLGIIDSLLDAPRAHYWTRSTGELLARVDTDVETATSVLMPLAFSVSVISLILVSLISLLILHPFFFVVALLLFPVLAVLQRFFVRAVEGPASRAQALIGELSEIAHESLDGIMVVKTIGRQKQELDRLIKSSERLREERLKIGWQRSVFSPLLYHLPNFGILILLMVGALLVDNGSVTVGETVQAMALFMILTLPVQILGFMFQEMPRSVVAMDRIDEIFSIDKVQYSKEGKVEKPVDVIFDKVGFSYPTENDEQVRQTVLEDFSEKISEGESVALVGSTGSGKSTLVMLMSGLTEPTSGNITLGNANVGELGPDFVSDHIAPVFQETFLFASSLRENLILNGNVSDSDIHSALQVASAQNFVSELPQGIETILGERGVTLSGGQRQRIAIARALLRKPSVLVLDDATSAVDPKVEAEILQNIKKETNCSLVVIAHRLATIRLAERVIFIDDGRVSASGSHDELLKIDDYANLVSAYEDVTP
ncbi:MAG: ABC transporter ATP-binding protein [Acidimicrobiales bacterium]|nr:ABC transporter ATP-binding protein [Acidimicrobiales bacterium]MDP6285707.1 ABC transporter ATP-binding protein [Acidimicrobiales bacterium]HJO40874.1 ABC transporter ATP-binding protein [Acidimicrobiales bacterium]